MSNKRTEKEFLELLEKKASEEKRILATEIMPSWARGMGEWLVVNPWRVMVPLAVCLYLVMRVTYGTRLRELILGIFGGFA